MSKDLVGKWRCLADDQVIGDIDSDSEEAGKRNAKDTCGGVFVGNQVGNIIKEGAHDKHALKEGLKDKSNKVIKL